jgi:hypothetical protein
MHRSGTSALAGALSHLGVEFVSGQDEMSGAPANPKGFFERPSIVNYSDTLLTTHNWAWHTANLYPFDVEKAVGLLPQGLNLIASLSNDSPVGIKDPRSCLLMPFWRRALLDRFEAIVITRDPAEVAWSLHVRDGLPVTVGLALWIAYNMHLANGIQGMNPQILRYENLVDSPTTELASIAQFLQERGLPVLLQQSDFETAAKSIDPTLRRATVPNWVNDHPLTVEARSIRELFHQTPGTDISFTPSELCREVLDTQFVAKKCDEFHHELNLARIQLGQEQLGHISNVRMLEAQMSELNDAASAYQHDLSVRTSELEQSRHQLEQTVNSFSLKLGLLLTWPVRKLRPSNRSR